MPLGQGESVSYSPDGTKILLGMEGADSEVEAQDAPGDGGSESPSGSGSSSPSGSDGGGTSDGTIKIGALALGAVAALFGLRRLFRRS